MKRIFSQYAGLKREVYILALGRLVTAMGSFVWPIMTFFLTVRLGFSDARAATVMATATILSLPAALLGGRLADRYSRKSIIIAFDLITVSLYLLAAFLPINTLTAALIFVAALSQTMEHPAYDALNADFSTSAQREKSFSLSYLGYNLGFIVGASVAGILFREHLRLAFVLNSMAVLASTVLIVLFVHPEQALVSDGCGRQTLTEYEQPVEEHMPLFSVLRRTPVVLWVLLVGCMGCFPGHVVGVLLPLQLKAAMGDAGASVYGYLSSLNGLTVILFTPLCAVLLKKITELPKVAAGMLLFGAGMLLFPVPGGLWIAFAAMTVFSVGEVVVVLGEKPYSSRRMPASHRGRAGGLITVLNSVFSSCAQYLTSFILLLTGSNYRVVWILFGTCSMGAALVYCLLYPADRKTFPKLYSSQ